MTDGTYLDRFECHFTYNGTDGYPFSREENHGIGTRSVLAFVNINDGIQYNLKTLLFVGMQPQKYQVG